MGRSKAKSKPAAVSTSKPAATKPAVLPVAPRRDLRPYIYGGLSLVFAAIQAYLVWKVIPNRLPSAAIHLWSLPIGMLVMGVATLTRTPLGWKIAIAAGSAVLLSTILMIVRILVSAAFLSGVYGAFGKAAAMSALTGVALLVELVGLLPLFGVKYLLTRSGRAAFGA